MLQIQQNEGGSSFLQTLWYIHPPEPAYPYAISLCTLDECNWQHLSLLHFEGKSL